MMQDHNIDKELLEIQEILNEYLHKKEIKKIRKKKNNISVYLTKNYWLFSIYIMLGYSVFGLFLIKVALPGLSIDETIFNISKILFILSLYIYFLLVSYVDLILKYAHIFVELRYLKPIRKKKIIDLPLKRDKYFPYELKNYDQKSINYIKLKLENEISDLEKKEV